MRHSTGRYRRCEWTDKAVLACRSSLRKLSVLVKNGVLDMANWVECTRRDGRKVHVNLDLASTISAVVAANGTSATRIVFPGQPEDYVDVIETAEQIMKAARRGDL